MSVPSRQEAAALLSALQPSDWLLRHSTVVAEVASFLAVRAAGRGLPLDGRLVESAALLHDLDKALPRDHPLLELGHGAAGAAWLAQRGHAELCAAVAGHPVTLLRDERRYPDWAAQATLEERVVAYADKRAEQELVSLEQRFATWRRRYPEDATGVGLAFERAQRLEAEVCGAAGIEPADVARAAWATQALDAVSER